MVMRRFGPAIFTELLPLAPVTIADQREAMTKFILQSGRARRGEDKAKAEEDDLPPGSLVLAAIARRNRTS
jgi:hypothetical protein